MSFSIYAKDRSVRLTVTTPDGEQAIVENASGDTGFRMSFDCKRSMDSDPGECVVQCLNLPPDVLGLIESAQVSKADDPDAILVGKQLQSAVVNAEGADALGAGFLILELEAGYNGSYSRLFKAVGARSSSSPDGDDVTTITTIRASENLDGALLGLPMATFPAGTTLHELIDYLRKVAGLGVGNLSLATLTALIGESRLDSPYHVSGGQALAFLRNALQYLPLRWFIDDREIWLCGRDEVPSPTGAVPWVADGPPEELEPIVGRVSRDDGGFVSVSCLLTGRVRPGRLVNLTEAGLSMASRGLSPSAAKVRRANVPAGLYRAEEVAHRGDTGPGQYLTSLKLRPIVSPAPFTLLSDSERLALDVDDVILSNLLGLKK